MVGRRAKTFDHSHAATGGFIGRGRELEQISALLLGSARLITLIGSGGIGKTRLAAEAVHRYSKGTGVPVYWTKLARLARDADVANIEEEVVQSVLDVDYSGRSAWDVLVDTLTRTDAVGRHLQTVLVMDNCEHVLVGAGNLIAEMLDVVPGLTILATSREAIGWVDERLVAVPPFTLVQAQTLFERRAKLVGQPVTAPQQMQVVAEICRQVHHNPLYIQLAAARLRHQPLSVVLRELSGAADDQRMRWSHGTLLGAENRHHAVADVIAWSYDLCDPKERLLLDRMSVFAAGSEINPDDKDNDDSQSEDGAEKAAIEAVCACPAYGSVQELGFRLDAQEIGVLLERLVNRSLVIAHIGRTAVRYSLSGSIRIFAADRLRERGVNEPQTLANRHRRYYRDRVCSARADWFGPTEQELLEWARGAWCNLRVAIESSLTSPPEAAIGLEIAAGLLVMRVPFVRGTLREMCWWTKRALTVVRQASSELTEPQVTAMAFSAWLTLCQGKDVEATRILDDCVAALPASAGGPDWRRYWDTDIGLPAAVEYAWAEELLLLHNDAKCLTVLARAREKYAQSGDSVGVVMTEQVEALGSAIFDSAERALETTGTHLTRIMSTGAKWAEAWALVTRSIALALHGDPFEALETAKTGLASHSRIRDSLGQMGAVQVQIWALARIVDGLLERAETGRAVALATEIARLAGGLSTWKAAAGVDLAQPTPFTAETERALEISQRALGSAAFATAMQEGARLRPETRDVQRLALGTVRADELLSADSEPSPTGSLWDELTGAEQEVALLAAAGFPNTAIAARRGSSFRTVDAQMTAIFQKLMITTRSDIIRFVPETLLNRVRAEAGRRPGRNLPTLR